MPAANWSDDSGWAFANVIGECPSGVPLLWATGILATFKISARPLPFHSLVLLGPMCIL